MAKNANKKIQRALQGSNTLTASEIKNLNNAGISTAKALTVAAKKGATIGQKAQQIYNIDQNKKGVISYTPAATAPAPKPGSGWAVTGSQTSQGPVMKGQNWQDSTTTLPTYSFMGSGRAQPKSFSPYEGMMNGPNDQGLPPPPNATNQTQQWSNSVDDGSQSMIDAINAAAAQNQANQNLYMGMINDLMAQMSAANMQQPQQVSAAPYAVMTTTNAPVQGAQVTQAINRRLKNLNTSLAISPTETATAGTGLNIPV
jgi:hypothetical protein